MTDVTPAQCRAARALLNWSQGDLATRIQVTTKTISDFEKGARTPLTENLKAIKETLETAGVELIPKNGGGPGARLKE